MQFPIEDFVACDGCGTQFAVADQWQLDQSVSDDGRRLIHICQACLHEREQERKKQQEDTKGGII